MRKFTFLMALMLIISTLNAQEIKRQSPLSLEATRLMNLEQKKAETAVEQNTQAVTQFTAIVLKPSTNLSTKIGEMTNPYRASAPTRAPGDVILSEGFESMTPLVFSGGWTANPSPTGTDINANLGRWCSSSGINFGGGNIIYPYAGSRCAAIITYYTGAPNHNAWLFSQGVSLVAGTEYELSFMAYMGYFGAGDHDQLRVRIGGTASEAGMELTVFQSGSNQSDFMGWKKFTVTFTPTQTKTYYLGFQCYTAAGMGNFIFLDDVLVKEPAVNELQINANVPYTQIPTSQTFNPSATATNTGAAAQTNVTLAVEMNSTNVGTSTPVASLASGATSTNLTVPAIAIPSGSNTLGYTVSSTQGATASATFNLQGTAGTFATDALTAPNADGVGFNGTATFGNVFEVTQTTYATGVQFIFSQEPGTTAYSVSIFEMTGDLTTAATALVTQTGNRAPGEVTITIAPVQLQPGKYFLGITQTQNILISYDSRAEGGFYQKNGNDLVYYAGGQGFGSFAIRMLVGTPQANDAAITAITAPVSGMNLTATEAVTATIRNNGSNPITSIDLELTVNGGTPIVETYSGTIATGASYNYTFTATANLSAAGDHTITVRAILAGDGNPDNDSYTITVNNVVCNTISSFPWTEGFEDATFPPHCWTSYNVDGGGTQWARNTTYTYNGSSGSAGHGYSSAGMQEGWLVTPPMTIPVTGNYIVEFWSYNQFPTYHYYGGVWVSSTDGSVASFTEVKQLSGTEISASWKKIIVPLSDYAGQDIYIGFKYMGDDADSWYIDDVRVLDFANFVDAEVSAITAPVSGINLSNAEQVKVTVKNNGSAPITGFGLKLELDGAVVATETYTGTIASLSQAEYTFTQTLNLSAEGEYQVKVTVILSGDQVSDNDSKTITVTNTICANITSFPWTENFNDPDNLACWQMLGGDDYGDSWFPASFEGNPNGFMASLSQMDFLGMFMIPLNPDNWLVTPKLVLGNANYSLSFKVASVAEAPYNVEKYSVLVSTTGTAISNFTAIHTETITSSNMKTVTLPLNTYAGQSIYIAFRHWDSEGYALILDDVSVAGASNIPVVNGNEINIFQNNGEVNVIVSENSKIRVLDMLGRVLGNYNVGANSTLKVSQPAGVYLLEVRNGGAVSTHKVIVK